MKSIEELLAELDETARLITPRQAVEYLLEPGPAYVEARLTPDDTFKVQVVKAYLMALFKALERQNTRQIGYSVFSDGGEYPAQLYDAYGLVYPIGGV